MPSKTAPLRKKITLALDDSSRDRLSITVNLLIIGLIIISIISIVLESEPSISGTYGHILRYIDVVAVSVFSVEYLARLWIAPDLPKYKDLPPSKARLKYAMSPMAIIDLLAILPMLLAFISVDLRFLRILRLLRIFKLTRYNSTITTLLTVLRNESRSFAAACFVLVIMLIIASSFIYLIEGKTQPEAFGSIPKAMWWALITLTTVGYGDVTPITPMGKVFGGLITVIGIGIVALPAGILASAFSEQLHKNKDNYRDAVKQALLDGVITPEEYQHLKTLQEQFDIEPEEANKILQNQMAMSSKNQSAKTDACPHCGKSLPAKLIDIDQPE
ncbi:ion transporter [Ostreibacterium oceani]|uniref:Ion transporter n=1 Tax=Ostreibacterium oceani TaxID=2654998 RepID=A0A6N7EY71_9GAMM|nr:ion transporter [Ostreibacterium oceani]MPV86077.1 ion transporter [Ostreibacterium oceani]